MVGFSVLSCLAGLSVEEALREGGLGFGRVEFVDSGRAVGVAGTCEFKERSLLEASLVENIRVNRFVIDGFSAAVCAGVGFCGSDGGAALPLSVISLLGTLRPF